MKYVVEEGKEKVMKVDDNHFQRANESHYNHQLHQPVEYIGHWFTNTSSDCFKIAPNFIVCPVCYIINYILKLIMEHGQILKSSYFVGQVWSMFTPFLFFVHNVFEVFVKRQQNYCHSEAKVINRCLVTESHAYPTETWIFLLEI